MKLLSVIGNRPQFVKLAPIIRAIAEHNSLTENRVISHKVVHTGQHYSFKMNRIFFDDLELPKPDFYLGVGSGPHGWQTGKMLARVEKILLDEKPDVVLVYGDTNTTLAGALAAAKLHYPLAHIEAGLRSFVRSMPEEINRVLTDHCADFLFCPTGTAISNLRNEGFVEILNNGALIGVQDTNIPLSREQIPVVINVGDVMYDSLLMSMGVAEKKSRILDEFALEPKGYYLVTIHRAENTDDPTRVKSIIDALHDIDDKKPILFPVHPRTQNVLRRQGGYHLDDSRVRFTDPVSYCDMLVLEKNSAVVLTDSGGVQREAFLLGVPCVVLREETEWVELLEYDSMKIGGVQSQSVASAIGSLNKQNQEGINADDHVLGDGKAAARIVKLLAQVRTSSDID
ncbi:MAG: UDP-N-acetylglucosamine 2-epimerase (non-hydrolyzing) [candidate division WOR-3 bacterium]|nr:MAG: UDP-N-acetylglucosamine 2-epimerase (non-hydrolyzing) [candidate division WOR-3 bacterium]